MPVIKLVLLIPTLDRSGAEKQFTLLATRLPRDEFDVHAVTLTRTGPYESVLREAGVRLTTLNKRLRIDPVALWRLKSLLDAERPDVLHSWIFAANAYGRLVAGGRPRPKVIVSERCVDSWKSGWQLWLDRKQIGRTTRLVGNSASVADFYRRLGVPSEKITVIPNGVDIPDGPPTDRDRALAEFQIPPGSRVIGFVGLGPSKAGARHRLGNAAVAAVDRPGVLALGGRRTGCNDLIALARHVGCEHLVRFASYRADARG